MTNGNWDSEAPAKKGLPTWAKVSLGCCAGCFVVFLLLTATCVGGGIWIARKGVPDFVDKAVGSAFLDEAWGHLERVVKALRTVEGTRALYRANPGLAENFPTEEDFLKEAEEWRKGLGEFPRRRPTLSELIHKERGGGHFNLQSRDHRQEIEYQIPGGGRIHLELESKKLVDVRVE